MCQMVGLFSRKKVDPVERERVTKMVIEDTERQIAELRAKLGNVPSQQHREQVQRYIEKLVEKKRKLEEGTYYYK